MLGDMLEVITNGLVKATPHRVPPTTWERYSITRFCAIDGHYEVSPQEQFVDAAKGPLYAVSYTHLTLPTKRIV